MLYKNATVYLPDGGGVFKKTDIRTEGKIIADTGAFEGEGADCSGMVILPGFIDIHIHGCNGFDCTDGNPESAGRMSEFLASRGVTSFCPTTMTVDERLLADSFENISKTMGKENGAYIHGINMEGPFISPAKKGAQSEKYIKDPDIELFMRLNEICQVRLVDIAPERTGADEFIKEVKKICRISAAHTQASYEEAMRAFSLGVSHVTHLFNAMTQFGSREPGLVGAAFDNADDDFHCELICDLIHIAPATLRAAFKILGKDKTVVISDGTAAAGLGEGEYYLGGQKVIKTDAVRLQDGTLAGSSADLFGEFRNLISVGIPFDQIIASLTVNPASAIGADGITGSIEKGKNADFVILNGDMTEIIMTVVKGKRVF